MAMAIQTLHRVNPTARFHQRNTATYNYQSEGFVKFTVPLDIIWIHRQRAAQSDALLYGSFRGMSGRGEPMNICRCCELLPPKRCSHRNDHNHHAGVLAVVNTVVTVGVLRRLYIFVVRLRPALAASIIALHYGNRLAVGFLQYI